VTEHNWLHVSFEQSSPQENNNQVYLTLYHFHPKRFF